MAKKKEEISKSDSLPKLKLLVGVNFVADGDEEETRIEAGVIEAGILPPAFEAVLRESGKLVDLK